jgi:hypothetical protein
MIRVRTVFLLLAAVAFATTGQAIWAGKSQASDQGDELVEEIGELIDEAERARAADPKFLQDLRAALEEYQGPKLVELMRDDFGDGDFNRSVLWREAEGEFAVDSKRGLHSVAKPPAPSETDILQAQLKEFEAKRAEKGRYTLVQSATLANKPYVPVGEEIERVKAAIKAGGGPSPLEMRLAELEQIRENSGRFALVQSAILAGKPTVPVGEEIEHTQEAIAKEKAEKEAERMAQANARAELYTRLDISNAFAIQLDVISAKGDGRFELDVFQGYRRNAGYRLAYNAGAKPSLELLRFGSSGERRIAAFDKAIKLEDGYRHRILLSRDEAGAMTVSLDGKPLMEIADGNFRDPFSGVAVITKGGDFTLREITVQGIKK